MFVLLVASALSHELPSIVFEQPNQVSKLHLVIVPSDSAGSCPKQSGKRERHPSDEKLAVRAMLGSAGNGRHCTGTSSRRTGCLPNAWRPSDESTRSRDRSCRQDCRSPPPCESAADLRHPFVADATETVDEGRHRDALHGVEIHDRDPRHRILVRLLWHVRVVRAPGVSPEAARRGSRSARCRQVRRA